MRFKPMYLSKAYRTINQADVSNAPSAFSNALSQIFSVVSYLKDTNPTADSNDFNLRDVADDGKTHQQQVYFFGGLLGLISTRLGKERSS